MGEGLSRLLDSLAEGHEPTAAEVGAFSDMGRTDLALVRERWPGLEISTRALLLERAGELADVNLDLDFAALGKLALDDPDPEVRERAVSTLWECEEPVVGRRLAELATGDANSGVRAAAALGLQGFVELLVMDRLDGETAGAVSEALRVASDDGDAGVRAAAVEAAGGLTEEWVEDRILDAYESEERELRVAALRAMGASALERWTEYISEQLYSDEPEMRLEAVLAASELGSETLVEPLGELLQDEDPEVVLAAVEALGEIGGEEVVELLQGFAPEAPEGLEEAVSTALAAAGETGLFRRFGELEEDDE